MAPTTLAYVLRWHLFRTLFGLAVICYGAYVLLTHNPPAPNEVWESPIASLLLPVAWGAIALGAFVLARIWCDARSYARQRGAGSAAKMVKADPALTDKSKR